MDFVYGGIISHKILYINDIFTSNYFERSLDYNKNLTRGVLNWLDKWVHNLHAGLLRAYRVMEINRA